MMRRSDFLFMCIILLFALPVLAAEKQKKTPVAQYWMSVETSNMTIPGMSSEEMSGMEGLMMGRMSGMGPRKGLTLQLVAPKTVSSNPEATHDIPPGQNMGRTLPLITPVRETGTKREYAEEERKYEKPKARMLFYWGCSEEVRKGQPKVLDTEKMGMAEFGKAMMGRTGSMQNPPSPRQGWTYGEWPNRETRKEVPRDSSLQGEHFIHGNYPPDIRFSIGEKNDFMAPVEFSSVKGGLADSINFKWKKIPTAIGYFAMAMGHNEKTGEMILWSSSEVQEPGYGLMNYLSPSDISKFIKEKVVMTPETTSCSIPKGIFGETKGASLQFIAYGDELNIAWPPKPKDTKIPHEFIWSMKLRNKSTGMLMLGQEEQGGERRHRSRHMERDEKPSNEEMSEQPAERKKGTFEKMRGIFGF